MRKAEAYRQSGLGLRPDTDTHLLIKLTMLQTKLHSWVGAQCWEGWGAGQGMRPAKLVASRFTASLVAALQLAHLLAFMNGMFQALMDHSAAGALFIALCALLPLLQWRCAATP